MNVFPYAAKGLLHIQIMISFIVVVWDALSLYNLVYPGAYYIGQAGLKFTEILLPLPLKC